MRARFEGVLARHWRVVVAAVAVPVGLVIVWSYLTPKQWESSILVRLDPLVVPGLREDTALPGTPDATEAAAAELATARGTKFQEGLASNAPYPFDLTVEPGPAEGTLRFTAEADSAERSFAAAYSAANGFLAWGRPQEAVGRQATLQRELDALAPGDPAAADLQARIDTAAAAIAAVSGPSGVVVTKPEVPDDPVAPNLAVRIAVAAALGLLVGLGVAWVLDRRRPVPAATEAPQAPSRDPAAHSGARTALGIVAVTALLLPLASLTAAVVGVWELRPSTNAQDEAGYACFPGWLDDLPDDTLVGISVDSPAFFANHVQEFAFPRLRVAAPGVVPEVLINVVPGPGTEACGGYHRQISRP